MDKADKKLLTELIAGNEAAFDTIFKEYYRRLVYFAINILKSKESAEEVVQDLFVTFWEKKDKLHLKISLKAYLYKAIHNNSIHYLKKQQRFTSNDDEVTVEISEEYTDLLEQAELEEKIHQTIEQLPEKCKEIFKLKRFEELKNKEIAEKLNISIKTVETQMTRALKFLSKNLNDYYKLLITILLQLF